MIKQLVCPVDVISRDRTRPLRIGGRTRYPKIHTRQVHLFELTTTGMVRKRGARKPSKAEKVYPCWKRTSVLASDFLSDQMVVVWARDYVEKHPDNCFYVQSYPVKYARKSELCLALSCDFTTPVYALIDMLLEHDLPVTNVRGDSKKV